MDKHTFRSTVYLLELVMEEQASSHQQGTKREGVIEGALHDANLLEKIALYEHHYSRDEYTRRAEAYEKFAIDVVEGSTWEQLR